MAKNKHNETVGSSVERTDDRIKETGEVFTPPELCAEMVSEIPLSFLQNKNSTFLDNSAGSGNFLLALQTELLKYHELTHINDNMLYAVEFMEDNHREICKNLGVSVDHPHFVHADALRYHYRFDGTHRYDEETPVLTDRIGEIAEPEEYIKPKRNKEPSQGVLPL